MGILPLKKRVNRDKCSFATKQHMFGVFAIHEILRYRGTRFPHFMPPWYGINQIKLTLDDCNWKHWMEAQKQLQKMVRMEKITSEASEMSNTWRRWSGWQGGSFESFSTWTSPSPVGERKDHGQHARQRQGRVSKEGEQSYKWNRQTKNMKSLRTFLLTRLIQIRWQRVNWWAVSPVWLFFLL